MADGEDQKLLKKPLKGRNIIAFLWICIFFIIILIGSREREGYILCLSLFLLPIRMYYIFIRRYIYLYRYNDDLMKVMTMKNAILVVLCIVPEPHFQTTIFTIRRPLIRLDSFVSYVLLFWVSKCLCQTSMYV